MIEGDAKVVALSGKVILPSFQEQFQADKYIAFSDHCDLKNLMEFVNRCHARKIYLKHGKIEEFSYNLLKNLGNLDILNLECSR